MSFQFSDFSEEQLRLLVNLEQFYGAWLGAERAIQRLPYGMRWVRVSGRDYLYRVHDRQKNGTSLGPRSPETEAIFADYETRKAELRARLAGVRPRLDEVGRLYRALGLPLISSEAAKILREADRRELLGGHLLAVGTNVLPAYCIEAGGVIHTVPTETEDFDMTWVALEPHPDMPNPVWQMLKAVDPTYTVNSERSFQALNAKAYEFELLVSPSRAASLARRDQPRPIPLPEQEWLAWGASLTHVVVARDGSPARLVVPDPRWFGLHKLWLSQKPERNPLKRSKDEIQGFAVLDMVRDHMPRYPLDEAFVAKVPAELAPHFARWQARYRPAAQESTWR